MMNRVIYRKVNNALDQRSVRRRDLLLAEALLYSRTQDGGPRTFASLLEAHEVERERRLKRDQRLGQ